MINILLNANGKVKGIDEFYRQKKPVGFELHELKKTLSNFLGSFLCDGRGLEGGWLAKIRKSLELYNLYGRMITKKPKGCSYYYNILNANTKKDGWVQPNIKLEAELTEFNNELEYDSNKFMKIVMEVIKMPFLNRLKQFMLRLLHNNLFLGKRAYKINNPEESLCFLCNSHKESRVLLFMGCETVKKIAPISNKNT